jgi:radical SAM protein with 4Fe4S-binding SPASM domain
MNDYSAVKAANAELNRTEYDAGITYLRSRPRALFVELTRGCNLTCSMCRAERLSVAKFSMSETTFRRIAEELFPTAELVDLRGWGESLILPDVFERMAVVRSFGARMRIVTNLSFRRDEVLSALALHDADVDVSLDTSDEAMLRRLRGGAERETIFRNLRVLLDAYGHPRRIRVLVAVQRPAIPTLPKLIEDLAQLGICRVTFFSVSAEPDSELSLCHQESSLDAAVQECGRIAGEMGIALTLGTKLGSSPDNLVGIPACIHPWAYCYLTYDGQVSFCDHLIGPSNADYIVGNLTATAFEDVWNGAALQRIRSEHLGERKPTAHQFHHCSWCYREKYVDFEFQFDERMRQYVVPAPGVRYEAMQLL